MKRAFSQVDVFTTTPYLGNPVAVVLDGTGLTTPAMQAFTDWTHLSEATFVLPPHPTRGGLCAAYFLPRARTPFCRPSHPGQLPRLVGSGRCATGD